MPYDQNTMGRQSVQSGPLPVSGRMFHCARHPPAHLDELLAEVNAEHQKIETPHIDRASYLRDAPDKAP